MRRTCLLTGLLAVVSPVAAFGQDASEAWQTDIDEGWVTRAEAKEQQRIRSPFAGTRLGVEVLEPLGSTRAQLVARGIFSDGDAVFSSNAAWTMEARFHFALMEQFGITGIFPLGIVSPASGDTKVFIGNVSVGVAGGGAFDLVDPITAPTAVRLRLGGAIEGIFPSASSSSNTTVGYSLLAASLRAYEPHLYIPDLIGARVRGQVGLSVGNLTANLELSVVPAGILDAEGLLLIGAAGHVSYEVSPLIEPFLEMGATTQVAGAGQIKPPFMITPGLRVNVTPHFRPAFFMSMNFVAAQALMFGVDLAAAMPDEPRKERAVADDPSDFLPSD